MKPLENCRQKLKMMKLVLLFLTVIPLIGGTFLGDCDEWETQNSQGNGEVKLIFQIDPKLSSCKSNKKLRY